MLGWFRRHATILMVVLGSAAMVIFGLGSVFDSFARSATEKVRENPTVAEWKGGKLTQDDIAGVYQNHAESIRFLNAVVETAEEKSGDQVASLADMVKPITGDEEDRMTEILRRMMMAQAAEKQGFVVGNGLVNEYIALISGDAQFSPVDLERINRRVNQTSLDVVRKHLQVELLAMQMNSLSSVGMNLPPNPTEAISLYGRTAERIECEVLPIRVEDYVSKVTATPTDSELRELYKEGKNDLPDPLGKKPGFKVGRKINVQYFIAKAETFLQNEMNGITDEQVQKEYDRLVAKNDIMVIEPLVKDNSFAIPGLEGLPGMMLDSKGASDSDDAPVPPSETEPPSGDAPALPTDDAPAPPSDDVPVAPSDDVPAAESTPTTEQTPEGDIPKTEEAPESSPADPENSSHSVRRNRAQFVSLQEPISDAAPSNTSPSAAQQAQAGEASGQAAAEPTGNQPDAGSTGSVQLPQADLPQTGGIGSDIEEELKKQEAAPERKYKPLTDVADSIRRSLALPIANAKMLEGIEEAKFEVEEYFFELGNWESEGEVESAKPPVPDLEALGKKYNLQLKQTGLVDRDEMKVDPLGSIQVRGEILGDMLFFMAGDRKLYEATPFGGVAAFVPDHYLFWNIENQKPHVVDFADCKEQVAEFWKLQRAIELAQKEAESISDKVNDNRKSRLSEMYPDRALPTGQFSWFDTMRGGILSKPGNVDEPSDEFMSTAFSLDESEAGVAIDRNRDTVYVIQSISGNRPVDELGADYLQNQFMKFKRVPREVNGAAVYYSISEQRKAGEELKEELGFEYDSDFSN